MLRKFKQKSIVFSLIAIYTIFLTGCNPTLIESNKNQVPQLVQSILEDPKTFNPVISQDATSGLVGSMIFDGLVNENPLTGKTEPELAKSWTVSEDKLKVVFTLRKDLKWSDGEPITADDVIFSFNKLYFNKEIPTSAKDILKIGQSKELPIVKKLNDLQIEFTLPEPFAPFFSSVGQEILPKHILQKTIDNRNQDGDLVFLSTWAVDTPPSEIIASSAYKIKEYTTSQRIIFEANPYYWKKGEDGENLPHIQQVVWEIVESQDTSLLQFRSGGLDSIGVSPEYFSLLKKEEDRGNYTIYNGGAQYGTVYITFNLNQGSRDGKSLVDPIKSKWFNNIEFRQAVAYGLDRQRMINNIYRGLGAPQTSPISVQSPFYYDGLQGYEYNPEKAKNLLRSAGFTYSDQGELFDKDGNRVSFVLNTNAGNKTRESMGSQIKEDLRKIGIQVDFKPLAFNVLVDNLSNSLEWDCILLGLTGGNEPNGGANIWFTDGNLHMFNQDAGPGQTPLEGRVIATWEEEIAQLFIDAAKELDFEKRKAIYAEIQTLVEEKVPFIYLINPFSLSAVRNRVQAIEYSALGGAFWNLEELKITE